MVFVLSPTIKFKATYADGCPLVGGKVYTYLAGTVTPVDTYVSENGAANTNPVILNAKGEADVWLDPTIAYKIEVKDAEGNVITPPVDNIKVGPTGLNIAILDTIGDLRNYTGTATLLYVRGYNEVDDACGGWFYWNPDINIADDAVIYFQQNSAPIVGRFVRVYDGVNLSIRYAGDPGNLDNSYETITRLIAAGPGNLVFPPGEYKLGGTDEVILTSASNYIIDAGATFNLSDSAHMDIAGSFSAGAFRVFTGTMDVSFTGDQETIPYWFGASLTNTAGENVTAMTAWTNAGAGVFVLPAGAWPYTGTFPTLTTPTIFYGKLNGLRQGIQFSDVGTSARFGTYIIAGNSVDITDDGGDGGQVTGDWGIRGNLVVDEGADIQLVAKIGTAVGSGASATGRLFQNLTGGQNTGTGETTMATFAIPAGRINQGDSLDVEFSGLVNQESILRVKMGSATIATITLPVSSGTFYGKAKILRDGAVTTMKGNVFVGADSGTSFCKYSSASPGTWANALNLVITGQSASGTGNIILDFATVDYSPASP